MQPFDGRPFSLAGLAVVCVVSFESLDCYVLSKRLLQTTRCSADRKTCELTFRSGTMRAFVDALPKKGEYLLTAHLAFRRLIDCIYESS